MKNLLFSILLASATMSGFAQNTKTIKGNITDQNGEPLIGATVKVGKVGTVTDLEGNYTINVPQNATQVEVSYIGMKSAKIRIKGNKANGSLKDDTNMMDELVVIGYGSVKKGDITNAVAKVNGDQLKDRPVSNIASALQGELAGVEVRTTSGAPGSGVQISEIGRAHV